MKLSYRGIDYGFNPSSLQARGAKRRLGEVSKARALGAILTYRGAAYVVNPAAQAVSASASIPAGTVLTYRGFSYTVQPTYKMQPRVQDVSAQAVATQPTVVNAVKAPAVSIHEQARTLTMNHHRAMKKRQQVMLLRSVAEMGVDAAAASHWERIQETFNPAQAAYGRSHAALS